MKSATPLKKCQAATLPRGAELYQCYTENFIHMKVFYGFVDQTVARVTAIVLTVEYCCMMQKSLWATPGYTRSEHFCLGKEIGPNRRRIF